MHLPSNKSLYLDSRHESRYHVKAVEDTIVVLATKEAQRLKEIVREILIDTESSRISSRI